MFMLLTITYFDNEHIKSSKFNKSNLLYGKPKSLIYQNCFIIYLIFLFLRNISHCEPCRTRTHLDWFRISSTTSIPMAQIQILYSILIQQIQTLWSKLGVEPNISGLPALCYFLLNQKLGITFIP